MSEAAPEPEYASRFDNPLTEVIYRLGHFILSTQSGRVDALPGWFCQVSVTEADLPLVSTMFAQEIVRAGLQDASELVGHFTVNETADGSVSVNEWATKEEADMVFAALKEAFETYGGGETV